MKKELEIFLKGNNLLKKYKEYVKELPCEKDWVGREIWVAKGYEPLKAIITKIKYSSNYGGVIAMYKMKKSDVSGSFLLSHFNINGPLFLFTFDQEKAWDYVIGKQEGYKKDYKRSLANVEKSLKYLKVSRNINDVLGKNK